MLSPRTRPLILVADDNDLVCDTLENLLSYAGYDVRIAKDGTAAVAICLASRPDLILCDVNLPQLNGFEVIREIETALGPKRIPFFLFSGLELEDMKRASLKLGAEDFIAKPLDCAALLGRIAERLGGGRKPEARTRGGYYVDLQPVIDALGADWPRLRPRAFAIAESVLARELGKNEGYVSDERQGFYLLMPGIDRAAAQRRVDQLSMMIKERLIGAAAQAA